MLWALQSCSSHWNTWYQCFGLARKAFHSTIFLIINVYSRNEANFDARDSFHSLYYRRYNHVLLITTQDIDALDFPRKVFPSTIFLIINVYPWNETNLATRNNRHSLCYRHHNHVLLMGINDINALDLQEKQFFPSFSYN